jgi:hypothetical protein
LPKAFCSPNEQILNSLAGSSEQTRERLIFRFKNWPLSLVELSTEPSRQRASRRLIVFSTALDNAITAPHTTRACHLRSGGVAPTPKTGRYLYLIGTSGKCSVAFLMLLRKYSRQTSRETFAESFASFWILVRPSGPDSVLITPGLFYQGIGIAVIIHSPVLWPRLTNENARAYLSQALLEHPSQS